MNNGARVSIVLLNWNGGERVVEVWRAARAQTSPRIETILVDNASTDGSLEACLAEARPDKLLRMDENLGFAAGMNAGFQAATGDWVMPLGNDVRLASDYVETCLAAAAGDPEIGAVGGKEYAWVDGTLTDHARPSAGALFLTRELRGNWVPADRPTYAFGVSGSMPLLRRAMLEDMRHIYGYCYDERFGTGYEDLDLWFRMQHRGWKALFCPTATAWHVGSASAGGASGFLDKPPDYQRRLFRNRRLIWMKNVTPGMRWHLGWRWRLFEAAIPFYLLVKSPRALLPWSQGRCDAIRLRRALREEAAHASQAATVPDAVLLALIR